MECPESGTLSHSCSGRRRSSSCSDQSSPEFEFWMVRNPSFPQPNLLPADQLFVDGVILPLHLLPNHNPTDPPPDPSYQPDPPIHESSNCTPRDLEQESSPGPDFSSPATTVLTTSKRWTDIFKKGHHHHEKKNASSSSNQEEKETIKAEKKVKERKNGNGSGSTELNINIWPFSRSRSSGNATTRPKPIPGSGPGTRKVNSAPCSRSNSQGESKSARKWPSSPGRPGVHLGRGSPVWQVRRGVLNGKNPEHGGRNAEKGHKKESLFSDQTSGTSSSTRRSKASSSPKAKVLNLNVPMCIGYRHHLSCRSHVSSTIRAANGNSGNARGSSGGDGCDEGNAANIGSGSSNVFNLRSLFTKKVY